MTGHESKLDTDKEKRYRLHRYALSVNPDAAANTPNTSEGWKDDLSGRQIQLA